MSFDCEGQHFEAIQSTDLTNWRPGVMILEESGTSAGPIRELLSAFDYECLKNVVDQQCTRSQDVW